MLTTKQKNCIKLMVEGKMTQKDIAEAIKISEQTICNWKKDDEFMSELHSTMGIAFKSLAPIALNTHKKLLNAKSEMVRYLTAKDILDRAGYAAEENINVSGTESVTIINNIPRSDNDDGGAG